MRTTLAFWRGLRLDVVDYLTPIDDEIGATSAIDPDAIGLYTPSSTLLAICAGQLIGDANVVAALNIDRAQPIVVAAAFAANLLWMTPATTPAATRRRELAATTTVHPYAVSIEAPRLTANACCFGRLLHKYRVAPGHLAACVAIVVAGAVRAASLCMYRWCDGRQRKTGDHGDCGVEQNPA
jgi:hypothetical protein